MFLFDLRHSTLFATLGMDLELGFDIDDGRGGFSGWVKMDFKINSSKWIWSALDAPPEKIFQNAKLESCI